jgi:hypothetical protein
MAPGSTDEEVGFYARTGGFMLLGIEERSRRRIVFRVKEKASDTVAIGKLYVKDAEPAEVELFRLHALPLGASAPPLDVRVDAEKRAELVASIIANLNESYVFPDVARKMASGLRSRHDNGEYDGILDGDLLAATLAEELQEACNDKHLRIDCFPEVLPKDDLAASAEERIRTRRHFESKNCGFERVAWLPPNIGYVKFNFLGDPAICGPTATAAMNFVGNSDAVIFDLRDNRGGDPSMVAFLSTYLFDKPTHLNDLYNRKEDTTTEYWTLPDVPGMRLAQQPVFILTSKRTFSGAEEFAYNLQMLKRATIVGETTRGGAHPTSAHRLDDHFMIAIPYARAVNPVSKTNWEGIGVQPDVRVSEDQALAVAKKMAVGQIAAKTRV